MSARKNVVVVGAGIVGASIAWHLARAGAAVTVLDAGQPGGVATAASFAWINASWGNPEPYVRLRLRSMAEWRRLAGECPDIPLDWCGGLLWDLPAAELEAYAAERSDVGYEIRTIGRAEALRLEPALAEPPEVAVHVAAEGRAEPVFAAKALLADAVARGATVRNAVSVRAVSRKNGRVGVETDDGVVNADAVVIAAGVATATLAKTAGIDVPLKHSPGLLVHSKPFRKMLNGMVFGDRAHVRQTAEGRLIAGADFGGTRVGDASEAEAAARESFAAMKATLTGVEDLEFGFHTLGFRPMPQDEFPIVGETLPDFHVAVMHSGVTLAPAVGLFVADEVMTGRREPLLAPYRPERFG